MMSTTTPQRSLKERQREEREQLIFQASETLIAEKGYSETSMDDIAARVGVSKGTLYLHFSSKEDLLLKLIGKNLQTFAETMNAIIDSESTPREKLERLIQAVYTGSSETRFRMMETVLSVPDLRVRLTEQKKETITAFWSTFAQRLRAVINEGKASGDFDLTIPTPVLQAIFSGLLHPVNFRGSVLSDENSIPADELSGYVSQFFFRGAAAPQPRLEEGR
jgi:TetR/AcrR family transcriptional regulator, fatty acid metabolism regulator protein